MKFTLDDCGCLFSGENPPEQMQDIIEFAEDRGWENDYKDWEKVPDPEVYLEEWGLEEVPDDYDPQTFHEACQAAIEFLDSQCDPAVRFVFHQDEEALEEANEDSDVVHDFLLVPVQGEIQNYAQQMSRLVAQ